MQLDREELAWAAGFFDGEGTFYANYRKATSTKARTRAASARVSQAGDHAEVLLQRFQKAVGGLGYVRGPYDYSTPTRVRKLSWCWVATSFEQFQAVIAMLWNWLGPAKRAQALTALQTFKMFPLRQSMTTERGRSMAQQRWMHAS